MVATIFETLENGEMFNTEERLVIARLGSAWMAPKENGKEVREEWLKAGEMVMMPSGGLEDSKLEDNSAETTGDELCLLF
jgi:hypothetical protein